MIFIMAKDKIAFFMKTMKKEYVEDTVKYGRFCFNHPSVFNKWEDINSAQYDKWDCHTSFEANYVHFAPIINEENGNPVYGKPIKLTDKCTMHFQDSLVSHTPICCFRQIMESEIERDGNTVTFSLGEIADRIMNEFHHDSFVIINADYLYDKMREKHIAFLGSVVYKNTLIGDEFNVPDKYFDAISQLFRKDELYAWQREYRFALPPSETSPVFVELGSIEDYAVSGDLSIFNT